MKRLIFTLSALALIVCVFAQTPEKMSYQAVVRNSSNQLVTSKAIGMKISILQGTANGTVVYTETQTPTTNANGLVSIEIGGNTNFKTIDWAKGPYFLKTETDPAGGTNYTITGSSQLLSVPYALHAKTAESVTGTITETDPIFAASPAKGITLANISNWTTAYGWGNHSGLYRPIGYVPAWTEVMGKPTFSTVATSGSYNDLINKPSITNSQWTTSGSNITYNSGNVGIGTGAPVYKLEVAGRVRIKTGGGTAGIFMMNNANTLERGFVGMYNDDYIGFYGTPGNNWGFLMNVNNGNIGIGTVAPIAKLDVKGIINVNFNRITDVGNPVNPQDVATKAYVDLKIRTIGEAYGGGIVFYVTPDGQHGLIAEKQDQSTSTNWYNAHDYISHPENYSTAGKNYTDWRLPTKYELNLLYQQRAVVGGFTIGFYWSSTESSTFDYDAYYQNFLNGSQSSGDGKHSIHCVRAIRAF